MALPAIAHLTAAEYLVWENQQPDKHEYLRGEVFAMVGATRKHVTVSINVCSLLRAHLKGSPCRAYMSDMKLQVEPADAFFYPDVFVTCDERDHKAELYMSSPTLIVEVLSESTAGYDRGEKFAAYRQLPALKEYVLIDPERRRIECFRRGDERRWVFHEFKPEEPARFESVGFEAAFADLFEGAD